MPEIDYLEETGPGIRELPETPPAGAAAPPAGELVAPEYPGWSEETIETLLQGAGAGIHQLVGQTEQDWLMTKKDLERIGPPLTRIFNRWEPTLKASPYADPFLVGQGLFLYGWRSALEAKRAQRDREAGEGDGPTVTYERGPAPQEPAAVDVDVDGETELPEDYEPPPTYFENGREQP